MRKLTLSTLALLLVSCFLLASSFAQDYFFQGTLNEPAGVPSREPLTPAEAELRRALAFDPDGRVLASGGLDKTVRLWNPHTGQLLGSLEHPATVLAVTFSPDGEMLASASEDNAIRLWDPHGRQLLGTLEGHGKPVYAVAFSADGRHLASGSGDGTVRLWDAQSGELLKTFRGHNRGVLGVAFSETGLLASAGVDWTIQVYEVSTGRFLRTLTGHTAQVTSVAFTGAASGDIRLISGSRDGTVHSWNPDTGELLDSLWPYPDSAVNSVALLANADATVKIASARSDGTVRLGKLDMDSGLSADPVPLPIRLDTQYAIAVRGVAFSPSGMHLASVSRYGTVQVWMQHPYSVELSGTTIAGPARSYPFTVTVRDTSGEPVENVLVAANDSPEVPTNALGEAVHELTFPTLGHHDVDVTIRVPVSNLESQEFRKYYPYRVEVPTPESVEIAGPTIVGPARSYPFTVTVKDAKDRLLEGFRVRIGGSADITDYSGEADFSLNFPTVGWHDIDVSVETGPKSALEKNFPRRVRVPEPHSITPEMATLEPIMIWAGADGVESYEDTFIVKSADGLTLEGFLVGISATGVSDTVITDGQGKAKVNLKLSAGTYNVEVTVQDLRKVWLKKVFPSRVTLYKSRGCSVLAPSIEILTNADDFNSAANGSSWGSLNQLRIDVPPSLESSTTTSMQPSLRWNPYVTRATDLGTTVLTVKFLPDATDEDKKTFKSAARDWSRNANIGFLFVDDNRKTDLRVKFREKDSGNNAAVGAGAFLEFAGLVAMDRIEKIILGIQTFFGYRHQSKWIWAEDLSAKLDEYARVNLENPADDICLHELGHALGFHHSHQVPSFPYTWPEKGSEKRKKIYASYAKGPPEWNEAEVDSNVFDKNYTLPDTEAFDEESIMLYGIGRNELLDKPEGLAETFVLSEGDKLALRNVYGSRMDADDYAYITGSVEVYIFDYDPEASALLGEHEECKESPPVTIFVGSQQEYKTTGLAEFECDDEVKVVVEISTRSINGGSLEMKADVQLFEGNKLFKTFEDEESRVFTLPLDGNAHTFKVPRVVNVIPITGTRGSYADVTLTLQADCPDPDSIIFPCYNPGAGPAPKSVVARPVIPERTALLANYPNPFNPETWIPYQLAEPAEVTLSIYSVDGKLVRTLVLGHQAAGVYRSRSRAAHWDGRNELGERVASGVYFYTLTAGDFSATGKMLIRK